jgi:hypothetical protein
MLLLLIAIGFAYDYWNFSFNPIDCVVVDDVGNMSIFDSPSSYLCDNISIILTSNTALVIDSIRNSHTYYNFTLFSTLRNENNTPDVTIILFENVSS